MHASSRRVITLHEHTLRAFGDHSAVARAHSMPTQMPRNGLSPPEPGNKHSAPRLACLAAMATPRQPSPSAVDARMGLDHD
jgi:hypothetical protein